MKTCRCGRQFDSGQWRALRYIGQMDDGDGGTLELRNCPCGSTIAVELPREQPVQQETP